MQAPYKPGEIRAKRNVSAVDNLSSVSAISNQKNPNLKSKNQAIKKYTGSDNLPEAHEVKFAWEIMTSPVSFVNPINTIEEINEIITEHRFRHLPVVSDAGLLIGLISDRDILRFNAKAYLSKINPADAQVSSIMTTNILTATPDTLIRDIAKIMFDERIGSLPIIGDHSSLVGIITRSDILRALLNHGPIHLWA